MRRIESSCDRILPVPRHVSSSVYSTYQLSILFTSVLFSFASINTYICRQIVDCLIKPFRHYLLYNILLHIVLRVKVEILEIISFSRTIRVQSMWIKMVENPVQRIHGMYTSDNSL